MTSIHDKMASTIAAPDIHMAMQMTNDGEQRPGSLNCGVVGNVQYSGLTLFLQFATSRSEQYS